MTFAIFGTIYNAKTLTVILLIALVMTGPAPPACQVLHEVTRCEMLLKILIHIFS